MGELISSISSGISIASGIWQSLGYIRGIAGAQTISALFRYDGTRIHGSEKVVIDRLYDQQRSDLWWYSVRPVADYVFVRVPIAQSGIDERIGQIEGEQLPDTLYWRWVAKPKSGVIVDGREEPPNVKTDFIVVGYKPKAVIEHFSSA